MAIGSPVSFSDIRKGEDKATRQAVHYNVERLVSDGYLLSELGPDGERSYQLIPMLYDSPFIGHVMTLLETANYLVKGYLTGYDGINQEELMARLLKIATNRQSRT